MATPIDAPRTAHRPGLDPVDSLTVVDEGSSVSVRSRRLVRMFESGFDGGDQGPGDSGGNGGPPPPADAAGLAGLERVAPGPELAVLVHRIDLGSVTDGYELVEVVAACRRLKAWADAIEVWRRLPGLRVIRSAVRRRPTGAVSLRCVRPVSCWPPASGWPRPRPATG
jgi:hypothetical protein